MRFSPLVVPPADGGGREQSDVSGWGFVVLDMTIFRHFIVGASMGLGNGQAPQATVQTSVVELPGNLVWRGGPLSNSPPQTGQRSTPQRTKVASGAAPSLALPRRRWRGPEASRRREGGLSRQSPMLASSNTTTDENGRADADTWIPAFEGMTVGTAHYLCEESIFEAMTEGRGRGLL